MDPLMRWADILRFKALTMVFPREVNTSLNNHELLNIALFVNLNRYAKVQVDSSVTFEVT